MSYAANVMVDSGRGEDAQALLSFLDRHGYRGLLAAEEDSESAQITDICIIDERQQSLDQRAARLAATPKDVPVIFVGQNEALPERELALRNIGGQGFELELASQLATLSRLSALQVELAVRSKTAADFGLQPKPKAEMETSLLASALYAGPLVDADKIHHQLSAIASVQAALSIDSINRTLDRTMADLLIICATADNFSQVLIEIKDIRQNSRHYNLPIIVILPDYDEANIQQAFAHGASQVLVGPTNEAELTEIARQHINLSHYRLQLKANAQQLSNQQTDDLTSGLYNHAFLLSHLQDLIAETEQNQRHLSVGFLDIAGFTAFNRRHGYAGGDELLHQIGVMIRSLTRAEDLAARYAGGRFCILFPGTDKANAASVAARIAAVINNTLFPIRGNRDGLNVFLNHGCARFAPGDSPDDVIEKAALAAAQ